MGTDFGFQIAPPAKKTSRFTLICVRALVLSLVSANSTAVAFKSVDDDLDEEELTKISLVTSALGKIAKFEHTGNGSIYALREYGRVQSPRLVAELATNALEVFPE